MLLKYGMAALIVGFPIIFVELFDLLHRFQYSDDTHKELAWRRGRRLVELGAVMGGVTTGAIIWFFDF